MSGRSKDVLGVICGDSFDKSISSKELNGFAPGFNEEVLASLFGKFADLRMAGFKGTLK